ncbi:MAG: hypothetical protein K2I08_10140 [Muribaculaceae bacterium]|nr:hypothetical protein [Muribaculaceae bacterium]
MTNNLAEYSGLTDWDDQQDLAVLLPFLTKYGKAKKSDIAGVIGSQISETQLRRIIERLSQRGGPLLKTGKTTNIVYSISPEFKGQMSLLQEATRIDLTRILKGQDDKETGEEDRSDGTSDGIISKKTLMPYIQVKTERTGETEIDFDTSNDANW